MRKHRCHFCEGWNGLILFRPDKYLCPKCYSKIAIDNIPLQPAIRKQIIFTPVVDWRGTLDYMTAQIIANFMHNGLTVSNVARQLGITRSTVYKKLRKYNLIIPNSEDKVRLQATLSDIDHADGLHRMRVVQKGTKKNGNDKTI